MVNIDFFILFLPLLLYNYTKLLFFVNFISHHKFSPSERGDLGLRSPTSCRLTPPPPAHSPAHTPLRVVCRKEWFTTPPFGGATSSMRRTFSGKASPWNFLRERSGSNPPFSGYAKDFSIFIYFLVSDNYIGEGGFEPPTSWSQTRRNSRYPTLRGFVALAAIGLGPMT